MSKKITNYELRITSCRKHTTKLLNFKFLNLTLLRSYALTLFFLFCITGSFAQVTIGKNQAPQSYSVLELVAQYKSGEYGGFRLPQLTTAQRDALGVTAADTECRGLMIYNMTTNCVETWNGMIYCQNCCLTSRDKYLCIFAAVLALIKCWKAATSAICHHVSSNALATRQRLRRIS